MSTQAPPSSDVDAFRDDADRFIAELDEEYYLHYAGHKPTIDGETIPFRMLRVALANEADRDRRERLERMRVRLTDEHLNPVYLDAARIDREAVAQLGAPNYYELYKRFGFRLDELAEECQALLDETERMWEDVGDRLFRSRLGIALSDARAWDVSRLF